LFGYRKYSMSEMFDKLARQRNLAEKFAVTILETIFHGKAQLFTSRFEAGWEEVVRDVKDILVIKTGFTLLGNEMSNFWLLSLSGVPFTEIIKHKTIATNAAITFQRDAKERDVLERQVADGFLVGRTEAEARARIVELEDAMAKNPVRELIDAAMYQTLVEDIATEEDQYSYKSGLTRWVDEKTSKVPKIVKDSAKVAFMTHDTTLYKFMNRATVLSDFTSRYVMYQHFTTRAIKPMAKDKALRRARAAFVNYDIPTHKGVQYLNDTGIVWFSKYYLRIQAVIFQLAKDNPLRVFALMGANQFMSIVDILDSSMLTKAPVNLGIGALEAFNAIDEIATIQIAEEILFD